jgi:hypothetical protein
MAKSGSQSPRRRDWVSAFCAAIQMICIQRMAFGTYAALNKGCWHLGVE